MQEQDVQLVYALQKAILWINKEIRYVTRQENHQTSHNLRSSCRTDNSFENHGIVCILLYGEGSSW